MVRCNIRGVRKRPGIRPFNGLVILLITIILTQSLLTFQHTSQSLVNVTDFSKSSVRTLSYRG